MQRSMMLLVVSMLATMAVMSAVLIYWFKKKQWI